ARKGCNGLLLRVRRDVSGGILGVHLVWRLDASAENYHLIAASSRAFDIQERGAAARHQALSRLWANVRPRLRRHFLLLRPGAVPSRSTARSHYRRSNASAFRFTE